MKEKVGTELAALIPAWATQFNGKCPCRDFSKKMDSWGADGCEKRRDQIIAHLLSQQEHLIPALKLVPESLKRVIAGRLLTTAIRNEQA